VGTLLVLVDPEAIAMEIPPGLSPLRALPFLGAALTVVALVYAVLLLRRKEGRRTVRWAYALTALSFCTFLWQLGVWNLLGWRF